eukprot:199105_1
MSAGSTMTTINTTHAYGNKHIKSVQLNAFGEVDDEPPTLPIIYDEPVPLKLKQGSVSEGNVLIQSNASVDTEHHIPRFLSMATLPSLIKVSRSDPVSTADHDVKSRKKSLRFGSIFM